MTMTKTVDEVRQGEVSNAEECRRTEVAFASSIFHSQGGGGGSGIYLSYQVRQAHPTRLDRVLLIGCSVGQDSMCEVQMAGCL